MLQIFIWIAGTLGYHIVIIWAYKYLFGSLEWNTDRWKSTILFALSGFAIAALAYFIVGLWW